MTGDAPPARAASRTIPTMNPSASLRDLVLAVTVVVGLTRFVDGPLVWPIAALVLGGTFLAALQVIGDADPAGRTAGVAVESVISPGLAALAGLGALRVLPVGLLLVPAFPIVAWFLHLTLATEARLARSTTPPSSADRTAVLVQGLVAAFGAFIGIAILLPGGLPTPGATAPAAVGAGELGLLAAADGLIAFLLGYRIAALRSSNVRDVAWSAAEAAVAVAIAAVILRSIAIPGPLGPALLVLVFFLWDALHGSTSSRRRDNQRTWETVLLVVLGLIVVAWSLGLRG
jgi:hypothetical protein